MVERSRVTGPPAAPDLLAALKDWQTWLRIERRAAPHTCAAYARDLTQFLGFVAGHLGGEPRIKDLDEEGFDVTFVFCVLHQNLLNTVDNPEVAYHFAKGWNDWITEWTDGHTDRTRGTAILPLHDIDLAVKELRRSEVARLVPHQVLVRCSDYYLRQTADYLGELEPGFDKRVSRPDRVGPPHRLARLRPLRPSRPPRFEPSQKVPAS